MQGIHRSEILARPLPGLWPRFAVHALLACVLAWGCAGEEARPQLSRPVPHPRWEPYQRTLRAFLQKEKLPLIDLEVTLSPETDLSGLIAEMDNGGVALAAVTGPSEKIIREAVRAHPARLIPLTTEGRDASWAEPGGPFLAGLRRQIGEGAYGIGKLTLLAFEEGDQKTGGGLAAVRKEKVALPLNGGAFEQVLRLAGEKKAAVWIGMEPDDERVGQLEKLLRAHPAVPVIWTGAGRIRRLDRMPGYGPGLLRAMTLRHPNLFFTLTQGTRTGRRLLTRAREYLLYETKGVFSAEWRSFVEARIGHFGTGSGIGGQAPPVYRERIRRFRRRILARLSPQAAPRIAYRNAWRLLTGEAWEE